MACLPDAFLAAGNPLRINEPISMTLTFLTFVNWNSKFYFMARCYGCNAAYASHRRYVNTGNSFSTYYGKRFSKGTRSYYSYKFFFDDCAKSLDNARKRTLAFVLFLLSAGLLWYLLSTRF